MAELDDAFSVLIRRVIREFLDAPLTDAAVAEPPPSLGGAVVDADELRETNAGLREELMKINQWLYAERARGAKLLEVVERHWEDGGRDTWDVLKDAIEAYRKGDA